MVELKDFVRQFTRQDILKDMNIMKLGREFYHVPADLSAVVKRSQVRPEFAGTLLAAQRGGEGLRPSSQLLDILVGTDAKRVIVTRQAEWLCICGRPPLLSSVVDKKGDPQRGDVVLIMNMDGECIGYGKLNDSWGRKTGIITLLYDIGDFLRRERKLKPGKSRPHRS